MLIENRTVKVGDTATLKLVTGDEVIGRVTALQHGSIKITKPILLVVQMMQRGPNMPPEAALQFAPFMVGAPEDGIYEFEFSKLVVAPLKTREDVAKNYLAATSSIVPASAGALLK